jgi:hypothetical protein
MNKNEQRPVGCETYYTPWECVDWQTKCKDEKISRLKLAKFLIGSRYRLVVLALLAMLFCISIILLFIILADAADTGYRFI